MPQNLNDVINDLSPTMREEVNSRAQILISREVSLRELRRSLDLTQERLAQELGISQDNVSRMENRGDLLISTLRNLIESLGGRLSLVAEIPGQEPVVLSGLGDLRK